LKTIQIVVFAALSQIATTHELVRRKKLISSSVLRDCLEPYERPRYASGGKQHLRQGAARAVQESCLQAWVACIIIEPGDWLAVWSMRLFGLSDTFLLRVHSLE